MAGKANQADFAATVPWEGVTGKPTGFPPSKHAPTHAAGGTDPVQLTVPQVTGLSQQLADLSQQLAGKVGKGTTINGYPLTGNIVLTKGDIGLGRVDNTPDLDKPISIATRAALDAILRFNVKNYGATGDGATDDTAAINRARAALVAAGGGLFYFPAGTYLTTGVTAITTVPVRFMGDGFSVSIIVNTHLTNPTFQVTGQFMSMSDLKFTCTQNRANGNPLFNIDGNGTDALVYINNCQVRSNADAFFLTRCIPHFTDVTVKVLKQGGYALWCKAAGFTAVNSLFFTGGTNQPPIWIQGTATSISASNCGFVGAGPRASYVPTSITSGALNFTVNFAVNHTFAVGDWINISGVTPTAYRGYWRIASKTSTSVTITSSINPGAATINIAATALVADQRYTIGTVGTTDFTTAGAAFNSVGLPFKASGAAGGTGTANGTVYSVSCCILIDNELGPVNESQIVGCQVGASGYPKDPLSAGIYVDGRRGTGSIEGWQVSDSYIDLGRVGILLTGKGTTGLGTTGRWMIDSCFFEGNAGDGDSTMLGQVWVEQCPGVTLRGLKGSDAAKASTCQALYVYSDGSAPLCDGLRVTDSDLGVCENWTSVGSSNTAKYGAVFDGRINLLTFANNTCWGQTSPVLNTNSAIDSTTIVKSSNNSFFTGTTWTTTQTVVPYFSNDGSIPIGAIVSYSGAFADIPTNFHLCDGAGGTPNLTDRFVLGTNTEGDVLDVGGTSQHKHAAGTLAADATSAGTPAGTNSAPIFTGSSASTSSDSAGTPAGTNANESAHTHSVTAAGTNAGEAAHTHSVTAAGTNANESAHTHSFTASSAPATPDLFTSNTGSTGVSASGTTGAGSAHTHTFSGSAVTSGAGSSHTHTFTGSAVTSGAGSAHTHTFTGSAMTGHSHTVTATGTVSAPTFTGAAMATHVHSISGKTAIAEDLAGSTADVLPPWFKLAFIQRMS